MNGRCWRIIILVLALLIVGGLIGLSLTGQPIIWQPKTPETEPPPRTIHAKPLGLTLHGQVEPARRHELTAPLAATVAALIAPEGQPLVQGQPVMQLDAPALRRQATAARAQLERLQALDKQADDPEVRERLRQLEAQAEGSQKQVLQFRQDLATFMNEHPEAATVLATHRRAEADAATAKAAFDQAIQALEQEREAKDKSPLVAAYHRAAAEHKEAQARFETAREARARLRNEIVRLDLLRKRIASGEKAAADLAARLQRLRREPEIVMITQGRKRVEQAREALGKLERQQQSLEIKSPTAGSLTEIRARPGQAVQAGQTLAVVSDVGGARMVFQVRPADATKLQVGLRAKVTPAAGKSFEASISQIAAGKDLVRVYLVPLGEAPLPPPGTALVAKL